jgi:hypothetical protein
MFLELMEHEKLKRRQELIEGSRSTSRIQSGSMDRAEY